MATKKTSSNTRKNPQESGFGREILLLVILAVALILLLSNFGIGGVVGNAVSSVGFGLFGLMSYLFPIALFLGVAFIISNHKNSIAYKKIAAGFCFFLLGCGLFQLLTEGYMKSTTFIDYYKNSSTYKTGGGIIGGTICKIFSNAFGVAGAYVLITVFLIISLILMTQRSFFGFMQKIFSGIGHLIKKKKEKRQADEPMRKVRQEKRQAEKEERRQKKLQEEAAVAIHGRRASKFKASDGHFLEGTKLELPKPQTTPGKELEIAAEGEGQSGQLSFEIHRSEPQPVAESKITAFPEVPAMTGETVVETEKSPAKNPRSSQSEIESGIKNIKKEIESKESKEKKYVFPPLSLLKKGKGGNGGDSDSHLRETAKKLQDTLHNFGVNVTITNVSCGPTVTRYELQPEQGVKVSRIVSLADDIKLNLAAADIRIEAPIPGKAAIGIEVPNKENSAVMLRELIQSPAFQNCKSKLAFAAGKDIAGQPVVADIAKMPHLLIAGATGSGKSVCINTLIMSILYKATPEEVKLIMVDPKVVELSVYNGIPHLFIPVVTDPKKAAGALNWAVAEMTDRYNLFAEYNVRNLEDYNSKLETLETKEGEEPPKKLPQIVIIVDELADLMMVAPGEVEDAICRLAQLARAAGIHLIIATQRPSVNVITGLIKANMPSRIAFAVSSGVDSRTILDMNGAEKLLGKGDMLFYPQGYPKPARLQGAFVSDDEVSRVVEFLSDKNPFVEYNDEIEQKLKAVNTAAGGGVSDDRDAYFTDAGKFIIEKDKASIGMLQRMFKIGFNRAARIMDQLSEAGVVGPEEGTKPRKVLMSMEEFENYVEENV
ncbi:MAG: DNA translocase FtsK 4TM domain-containing protein [Blautia sp.]|jgi:S-DNA-T family DNA segregation ATPase FtsK/SpoIIIE